MPTSALQIAPTVLHLLWEVRTLDRPLRVLDVGPGRGKYGLLVREYVDPAAEVVAVEAWPPYIDDFGLRNLYADVIAGDVCRQPASLFAGFDAVLMVDVIEHIPKTDALQLLDRIPGWVIVATPKHFFENPADLPEPEAHVSHWTLRDFDETGRLDYWDRPIFRTLEGIVCRLRPL